MLAEADRVLGELKDLIRRINRTNAATALDAQMTSRLVCGAESSRLLVRARHRWPNDAAGAASLAQRCRAC